MARKLKAGGDQRYDVKNICKPAFDTFENFDKRHNNYKSVKEAVKKFCEEENISFVPIPDSGGTAIITK